MKHINTYVFHECRCHFNQTQIFGAIVMSKQCLTATHHLVLAIGYIIMLAKQYQPFFLYSIHSV